MEHCAASVIFATYNGASRRLKHMLEAMTLQSCAQSGWEIIAVDNHSTDNTLALLDLYKGRLPLKVLQQTKIGKSAAMNVGIDAAVGDLLVLTDDDVRPERDWLSVLLQSADENPSAGIFGGRILPDWEALPVGRFLSWIPLGSTFAIVEDSDSGPCDCNKIWGPNTAIRRSVLGGERFNELIGPLPTGTFAMGEDAEIVLRLARRGVLAYRCGDATVYHWIPSSSLNEGWVQRRAERLGLGMPLLYPEEIPTGMRIKGVPLKTWIQSANWVMKAAALYPFPSSKLRFWAIWKCLYMRGYRAGIRTYAPRCVGKDQET